MLHRASTAAILLLAVSACGEDKSGPAAADSAAELRRYSAETFYSSIEFRLAEQHAFSADGSRLLVSSDESGVFNAWSIDIAGGERTPLTASTTNAIYALSWFPGDDRVLLTGDVGGNEHNSVFVRETDGTLHDLAPPGDREIAGQQSGLRFLSWRDDGAAFFLTSTERDPHLADLWRYDATSLERELLFRNSRELPFPTRGFRISGDGRWLALDFHHTRYKFDIYLVDLASEDRAPRRILGATGDAEAVYTAMGFAPDSRQLIFATDEAGEFLEARTFDLASGEIATLASAGWDIRHAGFSPDGRYRVVRINADGRSETAIVDLATGMDILPPDLPPGQIASVRFDAAGGKLALLLERDTAPADLHIVELATATSRRLARALDPAIDEAELVASEAVRFASPDGTTVPGLLYKPREADAARKVPAMVLIHGGPGYQSRQGYNPTIQHLVNHGYAIYAINNRGSDGYGKTFRMADRRRHGEVDLGDVLASRTFLESFPWIDPDRIGVMGGSYGGYLAVAAMTFAPQTFDLAIDIFGVTNWIHMLQSGPYRLPRQAAAFDELGHPVEDAERLRRISPFFHSHNIARPMLVVQGSNDVRVPKVQTDSFVEVARANGVEIDYIVFEGEGHGFRRRDNRIRASQAYLDFLDRHFRAPASQEETE